LTEYDSDELIRLMLFVDVAVMEQAATVIGLVGNIVGDDGTQGVTPYENRYPEDETTTPSSASGGNQQSGGDASSSKETASPAPAPAPKPKGDLPNLLSVTEKLTDIAALAELIGAAEYDVRLKVASPVLEILSTKGKYASEWAEVLSDNSHPSPHVYLTLLMDFLAYITERRTVVEPGNTGEVMHTVSSYNSVAMVFKKTAASFRAMADDETGTIRFPRWDGAALKDVHNEVWGYDHPPKDAAEISPVLFAGECENKDVTFIAVISDHFPDNGRKNPAYIRTSRLALDSRVMVVRATANSFDREKPEDGYGERCQVDRKLLVRRPIKLRFVILSARHDHGRRLAGFFDELDTSKVKRRHCAIWNPDIGSRGGWDTDGIKTIYTDDKVANCAATKLGAYAVVAEIKDDPERDDDLPWLTIVKWIGYVLSLIALLLFIGVILSSSYLWEMFHGLSMHMASCIFLGHVAILIAELQDVREDRPICATVGCLINFFYVAAASLIALESFASFRAIVSGEIGGRTLSFLCFGYGIPMMALGYNVLNNLEDMGDDPNCMIGWENAPKWTFFVPMCVLAGLAVVFSLIAVCNICTPALRKESIVAEHGSVALGLFALALLFAVEWIFAPLAYIRFSDVNMPDFYPAFQVMNSFLGIFVLVFLGLGSRRFRAVITGKVHERNVAAYMAENEKDDEGNSLDQTVTETFDDDQLERGEEDEGPVPVHGHADPAEKGEGNSRPGSGKSEEEAALPNAAFVPDPEGNP